MWNDLALSYYRFEFSCSRQSYSEQTKQILNLLMLLKQVEYITPHKKTYLASTYFGYQDV